MKGILPHTDYIAEVNRMNIIFFPLLPILSDTIKHQNYFFPSNN